MKAPEHMDSTDLDGDFGPTDEQLRQWARDTLDELAMDHGEAEDFFESYLDPEGWYRYGGSDVYDAIHYLIANDPRMVCEALREYAEQTA